MSEQTELCSDTEAIWMANVIFVSGSKALPHEVIHIRSSFFEFSTITPNVHA